MSNLWENLNRTRSHLKQTTDKHNNKKYYLKMTNELTLNIKISTKPTLPATARTNETINSLLIIK